MEWIDICYWIIGGSLCAYTAYKDVTREED